MFYFSSGNTLICDDLPKLNNQNGRGQNSSLLDNIFIGLDPKGRRGVELFELDNLWSLIDQTIRLAARVEDCGGCNTFHRFHRKTREMKNWRLRNFVFHLYKMELSNIIKNISCKRQYNERKYSLKNTNCWYGPLAETLSEGLVAPESIRLF